MSSPTLRLDYNHKIYFHSTSERYPVDAEDKPYLSKCGITTYEESGNYTYLRREDAAALILMTDRFDGDADLSDIIDRGDYLRGLIQGFSLQQFFSEKDRPVRFRWKLVADAQQPENSRFECFFISNTGFDPESDQARLIAADTARAFLRASGLDAAIAQLGGEIRESGTFFISPHAVMERKLADAFRQASAQGAKRIPVLGLEAFGITVETWASREVGGINIRVNSGAPLNPLLDALIRLPDTDGRPLFPRLLEQWEHAGKYQFPNSAILPDLFSLAQYVLPAHLRPELTQEQVENLHIRVNNNAAPSIDALLDRPVQPSETASQDGEVAMGDYESSP
ncbi:MAG: hypothetical protein J0L97_04200, partial [Alphaproteobacteria bacterium]|nr:hypothetical protein [Alphaproteobacteria bacterium]